MKTPATILAVDDTTESLALLSKILTTAGYQVRLADSGELALAAVAAAPPDLILLDILMPGLDGLEVCRRLKARAETRGIPVILLSAYAGVKEWVEGLQLGAADHIGKPFQTAELLARISTQLALRHAQTTAAENSDLRRLNAQLEAEVVRRQQAEADLRQSIEGAEQVRRAMLSTLEDNQRAEAALRASDANQRALLEAATQSILLIDLAGTVIAMNEIAAQRLGRTREQVLGTCAFDHVSIETATARRARMAEVATTGRPLRFEDVRAGRTIDQSLVPIRDSSGAVTRVAIFAEDITERRLIEDQLRYQAMVLDQIRDTITATDLQGRITYVNESLCRSLGRTRAELVDIAVESCDAESPAELTQREIIAHTLGEGQWEGEVVNRAKDGGELTVLLRTAIVRDTAGRPIGMCGIGTDITARKRVEGVLRARTRLIEFSATHLLDELLVATLDEAEALTGSEVGFYHFLEKDQETLSLQAWSTRTTRAMCRAEGMGRHYDVAQAGVWVDCIRARRAVIHNDYTALPHRKGLPPGHPPVERELVVPVLRGVQIVAILGVGNKRTDYTELDIESVSRLADLAWEIAERKRAEEALRRRNEELSVFNEAMVGRELRMIELKAEVNELCLARQEPPRYAIENSAEVVSAPGKDSA